MGRAQSEAQAGGWMEDGVKGVTWKAERRDGLRERVNGLSQVRDKKGGWMERR